MTEKKANEIFRSKYPDGEILRPYSTSEGYKYWVVFNKSGKVYGYAVQNYVQLLIRLGFKVVYQKHVDRAKKELEEKKHNLELGYDPYDLFSDYRNEEEKAYFRKVTEERIKYIEEYLEDIEKNYIICEG